MVPLKMYLLSGEVGYSVLGSSTDVIFNVSEVLLGFGGVFVLGFMILFLSSNIPGPQLSN